MVFSNRIFKYAVIIAAGGLLYGAAELTFRGRTHWSMLLAGGFCVLLLYLIAVKSREPFWKKCIMGGAVITTVEFITGIIVNIVLGWNVWNYSTLWANLFGQICLQFSAAWVLLSAPVIWFCLMAESRINGIRNATGGLISNEEVDCDRDGG
jgi:uncharacterized membrane protein